MDKEFLFEQKVLDEKNIKIDNVLLREKQELKKIPLKYKSDAVMHKYMLEKTMCKINPNRSELVIQ